MYPLRGAIFGTLLLLLRTVLSTYRHVDFSAEMNRAILVIPSTDNSSWMTQPTRFHSQMKHLLDPRNHRYFRYLVPMLIASPISAILYVLSGIKRTQNEGLWLFRIDSQSYIRANTYTVIPILVVAYTIVNFLCVLNLYYDTKGFIRPGTVALSLSTYPILLCIAWTRIWSALLAVTRTKFEFHTSQRTSIQSNQKYFPAKTLNTLAVVFYFFPLAFGFPLVFLSKREAFDLYNVWHSYDSSFQQLSQDSLQASMEKKIYAGGISQMQAISKHAERLLFFFRLFSGGYLINTLMLFFLMLFSYFHIFRHLWCHMNILLDSVKQRKNNFLGSLKLPEERDLHSEKNYTGFSTEQSFTLETKMLKAKLCLSASLKFIITILSFPKDWNSWLPTLKQGTGVDDRTWEDDLFKRDKQDWERAHEALVLAHYTTLKKYAVNVIWQALLVSSILISYMVLETLILLNALGVPQNRSFIDLTFFTTLWANLAWSLGVGILLGLISCIVAFSPMPQSVIEKNVGQLEDDEEF
ncbi:hypothetical protein O181_065093 [Austropuccinia psidii MF-1]|uniref:Uncharacterized protein n=1 Tax=Austropuccinia psidii MF-1 TaxID=1389203 RepID=A0A9Q3EP37_9BASI|nr:hypothetical protein [Austropuccinia psidii MF-1]